MQIDFIPFTHEHLPLYYVWAEKEHVKTEWFREGYSPVNAILSKLEAGSDAFPFVIEADGEKIGFIQYYRCEKREDTAGFDIFIGEDGYLDKGYGTEIVKRFAEKLFAMGGISTIIVDPFATNKKAQRCYEKAGFVAVGEEKDHVGTVVVMTELRKGIT